ncbi:GABA transporter, putative, partial [Ixodes scapularis]
MTLVGAGTGLYYYLVPTWKKILEPKVWQKAAEQVFFSLSVAEGMIYSLGSYNHFHNSLYRDVYIIAFADLLVSFVAGLVVFSVLGHMAYNLNVSIQDVVDAGFGLAFVVYPESVTLLAWPNLWSFVFFVMLFFLALASEVSLVEGVLTPIKDEFPACQRHPTRLAFTF